MESRKIYGGGGGKVQTASTYELDPIPTKIIYYRDVIILTRGISIWSTRYKNWEAGKSEDSRTLLSKTLIKLIYFVVPVPLEHEFFGPCWVSKIIFFSLSLTAVDLFVDQT